MPATTQRPEQQRKRNRKRKRRNVSVSSTSDSSSDSSDNSSDEQERKVAVVKLPAATKSSKPAPQPVHESSSSSSSSSEEESGAESDKEEDDLRNPVGQNHHPSIPHPQEKASKQVAQGARQRSPSPLRNVPAPKVIPTTAHGDAAKEKELKDKFRKFWMSSIADAFSDDLNEIRKEPNLTQSRLSLLIDSLASGADMYSTSREMGTSNVNEVGIILGEKPSS